MPGLFPVGHELPGLAGQDLNGTWQSEAYGVNGSGQVVGRAQDSSGNYRAFLFQPGAANLIDLTTLAPAGWSLGNATGISDCGHITGRGTKNGATRSWLMYPQPQE
ncbi:MAG TPA: hypothetical protein VEO53_17455 [Candidatus Binatia bacterium]|nr:hypothetical protein [Candidatus Binatia bacterium]